MLVIPLSGSSCLTLHLLLDLAHECGGSVRSRLVSEEDIELIFHCPKVPEDIRITGDTPQNVARGDSLILCWKLHLDSEGPLSPDVLKRFETEKKGAP